MTAQPRAEPVRAAPHSPARATAQSLQLVRDHVPTEVLQLSRWVAWDGTRRPSGKLDKTPLNPKTGGNAMSNSSATWGTFRQAYELALRDDRVGGVGLVLTDSEYWALDFDHVIDQTTGEVAPAASAFLSSITTTYVELSPSGDGLHVIYRGRRPAALTATRAIDAFGLGKHLEVFGGASSRYITMTGLAWHDATTDLAEASQDTVDGVLAMFPADAPRTPPPTAATPATCTSEDEGRKARRALQNVPADDYDVWIFVGMALQTTFPDATARAIWDEWSSKSPKYREEESQKHWRSFHERPGGKTIAYLFWVAKQHEPDWWHRWQEEEARRPTPSVSSVSALPPQSAPENGARPPSVSSVSGSTGGSPSFRPLRPLPDQLLPVPSFETELLPEAFRDWVEDIAERIQCPIDFPAVAAVVTYSSVVGRRTGIRPKRHDDWLVVPNLWGGAVGRPGVMKTPGLQEPMSILRSLESRAKAIFEEQAEDYEAQLVVAKARERLTEKYIKEDLADGGDGLDIARDAVARTPEPPVRRRFLTNDSTVEKLGEILKDTPAGVLVFRDELVGLLKVLDKEGHEGSRAFYLEAWNGTGPFTFDRIGRGTIDIEAAIVSVLGGIQPGPLSAYLRSAARAGAGDDGLMQRFQLLVYPDVSRNWVNVDRFPLTDAKRRALAAFDAAAKLDAADRGAQQDAPGQVPYLRFDAAAQRSFDSWRSELEHKVRSGTCEPVIEAHLSKYRSLVPSLALLFHIADGRSGKVGLEPLDRAIGWSKYLEGHARRIYGLCVGGHQECLAIAEHILNGDLQDGFDSRSVYRPNWTHLPDADAAEKGIEELVQLGWLAEETRRTPGRTATICRINPRIWETHPRPTDRADRSPTDGPAGQAMAMPLGRLRGCRQLEGGNDHG